MAGNSSAHGKRSKAVKAKGNGAKPPKADKPDSVATGGQLQPGGDNGSSVHSGPEKHSTESTALEAFPEASATSKGLARVLLKKSFHDPVEAVKACAAIPREDLLRILGQMMAPPMFELVRDMSPVKLAMTAVSCCYACHSGYSLAIADLNAGINLHQEYADEQQRATAASQPGRA